MGVLGFGGKVRSVRDGFHVVGYAKIVSEYAKIERNVRQAVKEMRVGVIGSTSRHFFKRYLLRVFFKRKEKGEDAVMKARVEGIVSDWGKGIVVQADADWLEGPFLDFCGRCRERDLADLKKRLRVK